MVNNPSASSAVTNNLNLSRVMMDDQIVASRSLVALQQNSNNHHGGDVELPNMTEHVPVDKIDDGGNNVMPLKSTEEFKMGCSVLKLHHLAAPGGKRNKAKRKKKPLAPDDALTEGTEHEADVRHTRTSCQPLSQDSIQLQP